MKYSLVMLNGPAVGASLPLDWQNEVTLGRDAARELPVDDNACSRLHARIWCDAGQWQIEDAGSRNGTFVNSRPVTRATLQPGDVIRVGERLIAFARQRDGVQSARLQPEDLGGTTFVLRVAEPDIRSSALAAFGHADSSPPVRVAGVLCSLAERLLEAAGTSALANAVQNALRDGIAAEAVDVWLVATDGRLRLIGETDDAQDEGDHVLASLAVENNEALLVEQVDASSGADFEAETHVGRSLRDRLRVSERLANKEESTPGTPQHGAVISVPIPGRSGRRGAIECRRSRSRPPFTPDDLDLSIVVAHQVGLALDGLEHREQLERSNQHLRAAVTAQSQLAGSSPAMKAVLDKVSLLAPTSSTVLIHGESGTGKELVARMIHDQSPRRAGPYVTINCAAFNESLLESELFGHERGAFTGADRRRIGQFERASTGTIFLDEIGEMSSACQARLLRVLEGHPFERVGGGEAIRADVRVIAATHRNLGELVEQRRFREDLLFRIRVIELSIPPLRERGDDVYELAVYFLERFRREIGRGPRRLSEAAAGLLARHAWPGNVRELKNAVERAVVLGPGEEVQPVDLGIPVPELNLPAGNGLLSLAEAERNYIEFVLNQVDRNKSQACRILGIGRGTLYKKLKDAPTNGQ